MAIYIVAKNPGDNGYMGLIHDRAAKKKKNKKQDMFQWGNFIG